ncbi:MAG: LamG domain-containing protein [Candidatus Poribacteria bacterium]|nr:LamG domain-containing protein [Candidatus Poribacteria bacterium]|tara:strand:+ start:143 stop:928 length:786 start_codon:yes stop_codon:yes gene_type:complete
MVKRYFWLIMLCFLLILVILLSDSIALNNDSSLKLYLAFDEEKGKIAKDHSKSGLRGKLSGNAKFVKNGKFGGALSLEDSNSLVQLPATDELNITKSITIAAWIFPLVNQKDSNVIGRRTAANVGGYCMQWSSLGAAAKIETWIGLPVWQGTRNLQKTEPRLEKWHHVVAMYDGNEIKQYVNGKLDASLKIPGREITSQKVELHIGKAQTGLPGIVGRIDEVAIYDRALTTDEIKSDMQKGVFFVVESREKLATKWATLKR